jgi:hypothetical protein
MLTHRSLPLYDPSVVDYGQSNIKSFYQLLGADNLQAVDGYTHEEGNGTQSEQILCQPTLLQSK